MKSRVTLNAPSGEDVSVLGSLNGRRGVELKTHHSTPGNITQYVTAIYFKLSYLTYDIHQTPECHPKGLPLMLIIVSGTRLQTHLISYS